MARVSNLLLIGCLLQGALCQVFVPESIKVLSGSCVTIPCFFDIQDSLEKHLDNTCEAKWINQENKVVFDSSKRIPINGELRGILTKKDCTTTLNNIVSDRSKKLYFRLDCKNLKYSFKENIVHIVVKADPPSVTLTPSTLEVKEGTSVSLTCSAPAPCSTHPPVLTWPPSLGHSQETLQENQDKTKVKTSVLTFIASHLHHGKEISCTAAYTKQDGSTVPTNSGSLTLNISFAPQILSSSCTKAASQVNCSCETVGNPSPILEWDLDGLPINDSEKFVINYETLIQNVTSLGSIISVNQPQERNLSTLVCRSSSSLGSDSQRFYFYRLEPKAFAECHECSGRVTLPVFIATVSVLTAALVSTLLFAIWAQRTCCTGDTSIAVINQGLKSGNGNEVSDKPEEDIYVNTHELKKADKPNTQEHLQVAGISSKKKNEEGNDLIYSSVIWKSNRMGRCCGNRNLSGSSFLEEERCMEGGTCRNYVSSALEMGSLYGNMGPRNDTKKAEDTEYAQLKFRDKNTMH